MQNEAQLHTGVGAIIRKHAAIRLVGNAFVAALFVTFLVAALYAVIATVLNFEISDPPQSTVPSRFEREMILNMQVGEMAEVPSTVILVAPDGRMWINSIYELPATQNFNTFGGNGMVVTIRRSETGVELLESSIHTTWRRQQIHSENVYRNLPVVLVQEFD